jgi:hypothetical protein
LPNNGAQHSRCACNDAEPVPPRPEKTSSSSPT